MASMSGLSSYDRIQNRRAWNKSFANLAEQRSAARKEAAQRVIAQGEATRNSVLSAVADIGAGTTKLTEMMIRSRITAEAKAKTAALAKKYA